MIKKIIAHLLGIVMFLAVLGLTFIFSIRALLNGPAMTEVIEEAFQKEKIDIYTGDMINEILGTDYKDLEEYIDEKELSKAYSQLFTDYMKYYLGMEIDIKESSDKVKTLMKETCQKYEKETGTEIDESQIDEYFTEMEEAIEREKPEENKAMVSFFNTIYSNSIVATLVGIAIICAILIFLLRGRQIITHLIIVLIVNGLCSGLLGIVLNAFSGEAETFDKLMGGVLSQLNTLAIASFVVAVILIIINLILKSQTKQKVSENTIPSTPIQREEIQGTQEIINDNVNTNTIYEEVETPQEKTEE